MKDKTGSKPSDDKLRCRAEQHLEQRLQENGTPDPDSREQLYELQVHQIELEIQNDELRRARDEAEMASAHYTELYELAPVGYFTLGREGTIRQVNIAGARLLGIERDKLLGQRFMRFFAAAERSAITLYLNSAFSGNGMEPGNLTLPIKGDTQRIVDIRANHSALGQNCLVMLIDITERKLSEAKLKLFRTLLDNSNDSIEVMDPATLRFLDVNDAGCRDLGYDRDELLSMTPYDLDPSLNQELQNTIEAQIQVSGNARFESVHRRKDGSTFPVEISTKLIELDRAYIVNIVRDITDRKLAEAERKQHEHELQESLEGIIFALANIAEIRDPYTAGHNRRVAQLAVAIAKELGLPQEKIHGLTLAATIHDVGKVGVPAEILSKPGKLTDSEYTLIKQHAAAGYELLKNIKFPWPIAQMIWQHHERLDGTGYPQGLKSGEILLESKIITVADVMEAMSAHRPYRPALGNKLALDELTKNSGRFYDTAAVDACVYLFEESEFKFG